jgi:hypothetical protein
MLRYVFRRILWGVLLLLAVSAITFLVFYVSARSASGEIACGRSWSGWA